MKEKIIATLIILIFLIIAATQGTYLFAIAMGGCACLSFLEFFNYKYKFKEIRFIKLIGILAILFIMFNNLFYTLPIIFVYTVSLIATIIPIIIYNDKKYNINDVMYIFGVIAYLGLSYSAIISICKLSIVRCIYIFLTTFMCDIYSYIGTRLIGKHKVKNTNRTIEGNIFGIIMASFIAAVFYYNLLGDTILTAISLSFCISLVSILGDLLFYNIKNKLKKDDFRAKVIDQFDSVTLVSLVYLIIISII